MNSLCKYLLIVGVNLLCYYRSLSGDFVFDDSVAILKNKDVYEGFNVNTFKVSFINENLHTNELKSYSTDTNCISNILEHFQQ